jgi:hypothetical protein
MLAEAAVAAPADERLATFRTVSVCPDSLSRIAAGSMRLSSQTSARGC